MTSAKASLVEPSVRLAQLGGALSLFTSLYSPFSSSLLEPTEDHTDSHRGQAYDPLCLSTPPRIGWFYSARDDHTNLVVDCPLFLSGSLLRLYRIIIIIIIIIFIITNEMILREPHTHTHMRTLFLRELRSGESLAACRRMLRSQAIGENDRTGLFMNLTRHFHPRLCCFLIMLDSSDNHLHLHVLKVVQVQGLLRALQVSRSAAARSFTRLRQSRHICTSSRCGPTKCRMCWHSASLCTVLRCRAL